MSIELQNLNLSTTKSHFFLGKVLEESKDYIDVIESSIDIEGQFKGLGNRNLINPNRHDVLEENLISLIRSQTPFSLIRLGDGEGNLLFWSNYKDTYPYLASLCMIRILSIMFGKKAPTKKYWDILAKYMSDAIENSDFLGVHNYHQTSLALKKIKDNESTDFDFRGQIGVVGVRTFLASKPSSSLQSKIFCNCHVHKSIIVFIDRLLIEAEYVSAISCYTNILDVLSKKFEIKAGNLLEIPPQASNISYSPKDFHYPDRFYEIVDLINSPGFIKKGELYLVGAGLLGKYYCSLVKKQGGMAIDVGSMLDVLMGFGVRDYQNNDYIDKFKLV